MHLRKRICCNHEFTPKDIIPPLLNQAQALSRKHDPNLYGGQVKRFANAVCPECEKKYILWLKPDGKGSFAVLTISEKENVAQSKPDFEQWDKQQLRAYLDKKGVYYVPQWSEQRLRDTATNA